MFTCFPAFALAEVVITEVMYDPEGTDTGREWIEVMNAGGEAVNLTLWKVFESSVAHKIAANGDDPMLPSGGYAVIADVPAKFLADNPGFSGRLFDSAFSFSNEGEALSMRDPSGADVDSVSYVSAWGAKNNGLSLQKTADGIWVSAKPTPGSATIASESEVTDDETDSTGGPAADFGSSSHSGQAAASNDPEKARLQVAAGRERLGFVGSPLGFSATVVAPKNPTTSIAHVWSMGDGSSYRGGRVSHVYRQPGTYHVVLNSVMDGVDAVSRTTVTIREPSVAVTLANDLFVEVKNGDGFELNLGGWRIEHETKGFVIPEDTIVAPRSSVRFAAAITGFANVVSYVRLLNPSNEEAAYLDLPESDDPIISLPNGVTPASIRRLFIDSFYGHAN